MRLKNIANLPLYLLNKLLDICRIFFSSLIIPNEKKNVNNFYFFQKRINVLHPRRYYMETIQKNVKNDTWLSFNNYQFVKYVIDSQRAFYGHWVYFRLKIVCPILRISISPTKFERFAGWVYTTWY